ncbi:MAG: phage integrase N-terminal SAM-like domain-containing protein [Actinobacteria bacterium]|nr:phage integrase N-terminal SAM-like domain-containing protein [Actinomycetota bacterium]
MLEVLQEWRWSLQAEGKSQATLAVYTSAVEGLGQWTHLLPTDARPVRAYLAHLLETRAPATAHNRFRALRTFFNWCVTEGLLEKSPMQGMRPPHVPERPVSVVSQGTLDQLLTVMGRVKDFEGLRDTAILLLWADTGCRRQELATLTVGDVDMDTRTLTVLGKGRRVRAVPFSPRAASAGGDPSPV